MDIWESNAFSPSYVMKIMENACRANRFLFSLACRSFQCGFAVVWASTVRSCASSVSCQSSVGRVLGCAALPSTRNFGQQPCPGVVPICHSHPRCWPGTHFSPAGDIGVAQEPPFLGRCQMPSSDLLSCCSINGLGNNCHSRMHLFCLFH